MNTEIRIVSEFTIAEGKTDAFKELIKTAIERLIGLSQPEAVSDIAVTVAAISDKGCESVAPPPSFPDCRGKGLDFQGVKSRRQRTAGRPLFRTCV